MAEVSHSLSDMVTYWAVWKQLKIKYSFLRLIWKILNWQIWGVTEARAQTLKTCVGHNVYSPCILTITQPTSPVAPADISTHSSRHSTFSATLLRPLASRCTLWSTLSLLLALLLLLLLPPNSWSAKMGILAVSTVELQFQQCYFVRSNMKSQILIRWCDSSFWHDKKIHRPPLGPWVVARPKALQQIP